MSYSISLNGQGADPDDVKEVFENAVRALRAVSPVDSKSIGGHLSSEGISLFATDVADVSEPAADVGEDDPSVPEQAPTTDQP